MTSWVPFKSYVYDELPDHHIRLLRIIAVEPRIVCSIESYPLGHPPAFHAVSYAWGDEAASHTAIFCDGQQLLVTWHLHEGLRCMTISVGAEFLWVDAICIDQKNDREKAKQTRDMHNIFKTALESWSGLVRLMKPVRLQRTLFRACERS
jgi:Heterokaryon incompatibility protein (HET)